MAPAQGRPREGHAAEGQPASSRAGGGVERGGSLAGADGGADGRGAHVLLARVREAQALFLCLLYCC